MSLRGRIGGSRFDGCCVKVVDNQFFFICVPRFRCRGNPCGCPLCSKDAASARSLERLMNRQPSHFATPGGNHAPTTKAPPLAPWVRLSGSQTISPWERVARSAG